MASHLFPIAAFFLVLGVVGDAASQPPQRGGPRMRRAPDKLKEGDAAFDFSLRSLTTKKKVRLSSHQGKKPVALIFGSYT